VPIVVPLVALDVLVVVLWTIAAALAIALIMNKLSAILDGVPWVGGKLSSAAKSMAQAISNAAGTLEAGIDHLIGGAWHALSRYIDSLWHQLTTQAHLIALLAHLVGRLVHDVVGMRHLVHGASRALHVVLHRFVVIGHELDRLGHRVKVLERDFSRGIGHDLRIRIKALEKEYTRLRDTVIPNVRGIAQEAEQGVTDLRKWVTDNVPLVGTAAFAGAVAWALGHLGLSWLRCNSNPFNRSKNPCGLWSELDDLLGLAVLTVGALEFETLVRTAQSLTDEAVQDFEDVFGL